MIEACTTCGKKLVLYQYGWHSSPQQKTLLCPNCSLKRKSNQFADLTDLMKEAKAAEIREAMRVISENIIENIDDHKVNSPHQTS